VARPALFSAEKILGAAGLLAALHGPSGTTIGAIAEELGAPTGSIYHRFRSKDVLLAELWLQVVEDFQSGFQAALHGIDPRVAGLEAALHTPAWVRANPLPARLLLLHHRSDFVEGDWPPEVAERALRVDQATRSALTSFCRQCLKTTSQGALRRATFAVVDLPYAGVRPHIRANESPPTMVDDLIRDAYLALIPSPGVPHALQIEGRRGRR
jgi:AcrR family transcriptional regulator